MCLRERCSHDEWGSLCSKRIHCKQYRKKVRLLECTCVTCWSRSDFCINRCSQRVHECGLSLTWTSFWCCARAALHLKRFLQSSHLIESFLRCTFFGCTKTASFFFNIFLQTPCWLGLSPVQAVFWCPKSLFFRLNRLAFCGSKCCLLMWCRWTW